MRHSIDRPLEEDEFLLKTYLYPYGNNPVPKGFMTKLNQDGSIPVKFLQWGSGTDNPYTIVKEVFASGWRLAGFRTGESRDWAVLLHPNGYTVEIYLKNMMAIVESSIITNGVIEGEFKWEYGNLIKK